jgi:hypothetical protein
MASHIISSGIRIHHQTISSGICIHRCIPKMENETLLFTFQQMLHPVLQKCRHPPQVVHS